MSGYDCDRWRSRLELLLDGALPEEEAAGFGDHAESCAACRAFGRDAVRLHAALPAAIAAAGFGARKSVEPVVASMSRRAPAKVTRFPWRAVAAAAAAIVLVVLGSRLLQPPAGAGGGGEGTHGTSLAAGTFVAGAEGLRLATAGDGFVDLAPDSSLEVVADAAGLALRVVHGEVRLPDGPAAWQVETSAGRLVIDGAATLVATSDKGGDLALFLRLHHGAARIAGDSGDRELDPRESFVVIHDGDLSPAAAWLLPADGFPGDDEGLVSSRDLRDRENAFDTERNALLARVGQLMAEKNRLELEVETLRRDGSARGGPSVFEVVRTLAERADRYLGASPEWGGKLRAAKHTFEGHEDEALRAIDELLLAPTSTAAQTRLGLRLLGYVGSPAAGDRLLTYASHVDRDLRDTAIDGLASFADPRFRPALDAAFRSDIDDGVRVAAAGGLVRLGDHGEPLAWLKRLYENRQTPKAVKRRVLSRLIFAPVSAQTSVFLDVLTRDADPATQREIVDFLRHLGGRRGLELLESLTTAPLDPELLDYVRRALERTPDHPFRPR